MSTKQVLNNFFQNLSKDIDTILYYPFFQGKNYTSCMAQKLSNCGFEGVPFLVIWIAFAAIFFSITLKFVNFRLFAHSVKVLFNSQKFSSKHDLGEISPVQSVITTIASTVGIGNIAGVAIAIALGGVGAIFWMVAMGFLCMAMSLAETTLSVKYRKIDADGTVRGGPFCYLRFGLADINRKKTGLALAFAFAATCLLGSIGVSMFQINQATIIVTTNADILKGYSNYISLFLSIMTGLVLIGGLKRIANLTELIVPIMVALYITICLIVLTINYDKIIPAFGLIFQKAFDIKAIAGGMTGAIIAGVKRAIFSNASGLGINSITHSAAKTSEPVRQGLLGGLNSFIDTVIICTMTGLVIVVTKAYQINSLEGIQITSMAFESVSVWLSYILMIVIFLFAYSTVITYGYYGASAFRYIFGKANIKIYYFIYCVFLFISGGLLNLNTIIGITDSITLAMCLPNIIGLYLLGKVLKKEINIYLTKIKKANTLE